MEWFKFRMSWEEPLMMLSDDEIGRVMRAVLTYIGTEEEQKTGDRGDLVFCMIRQTLREDLSQYRQKAEKKELLRRLICRCRRQDKLCGHRGGSCARCGLGADRKYRI